MFSDRRAKIRSDSTVEREANTVRQWGRLLGQSKFNIINLIDGPLRNNLDFTFDINFSDRRLEQTPAFVTFRKNDNAKLHVRRSVWNLAQANQDISRFILAHEVGHLKMHRHDALGFSESSQSILNMIQEEERFEPQADKFVERLLVDELLLFGYKNAEEVSYMFDVPLSCAQRRLDFVNDKIRRRFTSQSGDLCPRCSNFSLVKTNDYWKCSTCKAEEIIVN